MVLLITKDMYDVAIPVCIMNDGSPFQFESYVRGYHSSKPLLPLEGDQYF